MAAGDDAPDGGPPVSLPLLDLEGDPYEAGVQHGRAAGDGVGRNVRLYMRRFREVGGLSVEAIRERAVAYRTAIEEGSPDYAAAMEGIAEGSAQDPRDVVAVNVRYEILYTAFARAGMEREAPPPVGGCTSFVLLPDRTADGHVLLGQNWDWIPGVRGAIVRERSGGADRLSFTEAGIAGGKIGLNAKRIGLAINGLVSDRDDWSRMGTPFHVRCREVLRASTFGAAVRAAAEGGRPTSSNFLVAQGGPRPRAVDIEGSPVGVCRLEPSGGVLVHTNHFEDPGALGIVQPLAEDRESTYHRQERMAAMIRGRLGEGAVSVEHLKGMLRDHEGGRLSVCRHPDPSRPPPERFRTLASVVMDLDAGEMFVASGNPCEARYRRYALS